MPEYPHRPCVIISGDLHCVPDDRIEATSWIGSGVPLQWRHNEHDCVSKHQPHQCLLNRLFRRRSKKTSQLHVTGLCEGNSPETDEFPAQMTSNAENVFIWWRYHALRARRPYRGRILNRQRRAARPHRVTVQLLSFLNLPHTGLP